jgi:hypothetical protein
LSTFPPIGIVGGKHVLAGWVGCTLLLFFGCFFFGFIVDY